MKVKEQSLIETQQAEIASLKVQIDHMKADGEQAVFDSQQEINSLKAELAAEREKVKELKSKLKLHEYCSEDDEGISCCQCCGALRGMGHRTGCNTNRLIGGEK
jgi:predicted RNase H-like nuclease (RuvC/YqgF family)